MSNGQERIMRKIRTFFSFCIIFVVLFSTYSHAEYYISDDWVNIRAGAGLDADVQDYGREGTNISLLGAEYDDEGDLWYHISYDGMTGYISSQFVSEETDDNADIKYSEDETELEQTAWKEEEDTNEQAEYMLETGNQPQWSGYVQSDAEFEAQIANFPESYKAGLRAIHAEYPNYIFTADYVNMDYEALIDAEKGKKVSSNAANSWRAMYDESHGWYENYDWDTGEWLYSEGEFTMASREAIAYYIDPRNFLNTSDVYMFMRQSYSPNLTMDDLRGFIDGSFLADGYPVNPDDPDDVRLGGDYAAVLMEAGQLSGVSPFVLAINILIEHGYLGQTPLISGYYEANDGTEYKGYYNFYDIGATGTDSDNVIQNGLEYAKTHGWTSRYNCIVNGANWYADAYIGNGQDTYYYREFNVINGWDALPHQYATAIVTAYSSGLNLKRIMGDNHYAALEFRIPIYDNMPAAPYSEPDYDDKLNNYYFTSIEATGLTPAFTMANHEYTMAINDTTTLSVTVPKWATYEGYDAYAVYPGENDIPLSVRSQTGYVRTYHIYVTSSTECTLNVNINNGLHLNIEDENTVKELTETDQAELAQEESAQDERVWGDANEDGKVSALDYIAIKNHIMETVVIKTKNGLKGADTNNDGKISALDYIAIKNYIMEQ